MFDVGFVVEGEHAVGEVFEIFVGNAFTGANTGDDWVGSQVAIDHSANPALILDQFEAFEVGDVGFDGDVDVGDIDVQRRRPAGAWRYLMAHDTAQIDAHSFDIGEGRADPQKLRDCTWRMVAAWALIWF